jgi:ABC-type antimicrobial peptide transport system permease subunit
VRLVAIGCAFGVTGAWTSGRFLQSRLFGVDANDPRTIAGALAILLCVALMASWLPARRAAATSPLEVLNS